MCNFSPISFPIFIVDWVSKYYCAQKCISVNDCFGKRNNSMHLKIQETKRDIGLSKKIQIHPLKPDMRTPVDNDQKVINYNETLTLEDSVDKVCVFGV